MEQIARKHITEYHQQHQDSDPGPHDVGSYFGYLRSGHVYGSQGGHCPVEHKSCHTLSVKKKPAKILCPVLCDHVQYKSEAYHEDAHADGHYEQLIGVMHRREPQRRDNVLQPEDASVQPSENDGTCRCVFHYLAEGTLHHPFFYKDGGGQEYHQPVSYVSEHETEKEYEGYCHDRGRVDLSVGGKAVHRHYILEGPEEGVVLKECGYPYA